MIPVAIPIAQRALITVSSCCLDFNETIPMIMEIVDSMGGISILSHVDSNCGIDVEMPASTPTKQLILESPYLRGIEVTKIETLDRYGHCACIRNSDAHSLDEIGQRYTLIKMGEPCFEGLRQALGDYKSRIRENRDFKCCFKTSSFEKR